MTIAMRRGGTLSYLHTDHLSSSSLATDASGNAIPVNSQGVRYYAYGAVRSGNPANLQTDRTFTGQEQDGTGLMYYRARYYDGSLGTFISPDTVVPEPGRVSDFNRFAYVRSNPLKYSDPSGHLTEDEIRALLGENYDMLWNLWMTYDAYWVDLLLNGIQAGGVLWASDFGDVELHFEGSGANISLSALNGDSSSQLWDWQGKGAYRYRNARMSDQEADYARDELFDRHESNNALWSPVFDYGRQVSGKIQPTYLGARQTIQSIGDWQWSSATVEVFNLIGAPEWVGATAGDVAITWAIGTKLSSGPGLAFEALNVAVGSIYATYQAPKHYTDFWAGSTGPINSNIPLEWLQ